MIKNIHLVANNIEYYLINIESGNMLEKIKESCNYVAKNSKYVSINYDVLDEYIKNIDYDNMRHEILNEVNHEKVYNDVLNFFNE